MLLIGTLDVQQLTNEDRLAIGTKDEHVGQNTVTAIRNGGGVNRHPSSRQTCG